MRALIIGRCAKSAEQLQSFCEKVYVVLDNSFQNQRSIPELDGFELIFSNVNISRVTGILGRAREINKWINKYNLDIVFSNTKWDMVAAKVASFLHKKRIVLLATSHNSYSWQNDRKVRFLSWLIRSTTDCYITLASFVFKKLVDCHCKEEHLLLLPNTINTKAWERKCDYTFSSTFRLVYVAVLYPGKGQELLIDIVERLRDENIQIDCYGDYVQIDYVQRLEHIISEKKLSGKIRLLGRIENSDLRNILKNYDAYICPSLMEMSPVNILEAMATGLPVIASRTGGIPDIIDDENTGLLFDVGNADQAAAQIKRTISNPLLRREVGMRGLRYVSEVYTPKHAGNHIYNRVISILDRK